MARLILTANGVNGTLLMQAGRADLVVAILHRFVWGPIASDAKLSTYLAPRTTQSISDHWLGHGSFGAFKSMGGRRHGFLELVERCESVELWMEGGPNDQLVLIWLLDYLSNYPDISAKILLRHIDFPLFDPKLTYLKELTFRGVNICSDHFDIARLAWSAFRAPTPRAWVELLKRDLSVLPQLRRCVQEMLDELPGLTTGLGASELRILELLSAGYRRPFDLLPCLTERFQRRVYDDQEGGTLLEGLTFAPNPAISGLTELSFTPKLDLRYDHRERLERSKLSLTPHGRAILNGEADFTEHNPIYRWWGGTELSNQNLWRWDSALATPEP
jgi:hypothetical protein